MEKAFTEERNFVQADLLTTALSYGDYENCCFTNCDLSNTDLSGFHFQDCEFIGCNLGMSKLVKTAFRNVSFKEVNYLGLNLMFAMSFCLK